MPQMSNRLYRMIKYHPPTGKPHHFPYFFEVLRLIAMNRTFFTGRFLFVVWTLFKSQKGIIEQVTARIAQLPVTFCATTVEAYHQPNRFLFPFDFVFHPYFLTAKLVIIAKLRIFAKI